MRRCKQLVLLWISLHTQTSLCIFITLFNHTIVTGDTSYTLAARFIDHLPTIYLYCSCALNLLYSAAAAAPPSASALGKRNLPFVLISLFAPTPLLPPPPRKGLPVRKRRCCGKTRKEAKSQDWENMQGNCLREKIIGYRRGMPTTWLC